MTREQAREAFMENGGSEADFDVWWRTRQVPGVGDDGTPLLVLDYEEALTIDSWLPGWWEKGQALVVAAQGYGEKLEPATAGLRCRELRKWEERERITMAGAPTDPLVLGSMAQYHALYGGGPRWDVSVYAERVKRACLQEQASRNMTGWMEGLNAQSVDSRGTGDGVSLGYQEGGEWREIAFVGGRRSGKAERLRSLCSVCSGLGCASCGGSGVVS